MLRALLFSFGFGLVVGLGHASAAENPVVTVAPNDAAVFSPKLVTVDMGQSVEWDWASDGFSTTDTSGFTLWDSGVLDRGAMFSYEFDWGGTYPYGSSTDPSMAGKVRVRMAISPGHPAKGETFTMILGTSPPPPNAGFHVQVMWPTRTRWQNFISNTNELSVTRSLGVSGLWQFRMEVKRFTVPPVRSNWSPILKVRIP